jgi:hypothetical protein
MSVWQGVAKDSPKFFLGPPCPTPLRPAGGSPLDTPRRTPMPLASLDLIFYTTAFLGASKCLYKRHLDDERGDFLADQMDNSNFFILNSNSKTRCPSNGSLSSPDISLISAHLALSVH